MDIVEYPVNVFDAFLDGLQCLLLATCRRRFASNNAALDAEMTRFRAELFELDEDDGEVQAAADRLVAPALVGIPRTPQELLYRPIWCPGGAHTPFKFVTYVERPRFEREAPPHVEDPAQWQFMYERNRQMVAHAYLDVANACPFYSKENYAGPPSIVRVRRIAAFGQWLDLARGAALQRRPQEEVSALWQRGEAEFERGLSGLPLPPRARSFVRRYQPAALPVAVVEYRCSEKMTYAPRFTNNVREFLSAIETYAAVRCFRRHAPDYALATEALRSLLFLIVGGAATDPESLSDAVEAQLGPDGPQPPEWTLLYKHRPVFSAREAPQPLSYIGGDGPVQPRLDDPELGPLCRWMQFVADAQHATNFTATDDETVHYALREQRQRRHGFARWLACAQKTPAPARRADFVRRAWAVFARDNADSMQPSLKLRADELRALVAAADPPEEEEQTPDDPWAKRLVDSFESAHCCDPDGSGVVHVFAAGEFGWPLKRPYLFLAFHEKLSSEEHSVYRDAFDDSYEQLCEEWHSKRRLIA